MSHQLQNAENVIINKARMTKYNINIHNLDELEDFNIIGIKEIKNDNK